MQDQSEQLIPALSRTPSHACHTLLKCWQVQVLYQYACESTPPPPPSTPKPPRQQLKEAVNDPPQVTFRKTFSLPALGAAHSRWAATKAHTHTWLSVVFSFACRPTHTYTCPCSDVVPTASQDQLMALLTGRMERCWQTAGGEHSETTRHEKW